ncbi:nucleoside triphosphate pyrophosphohydrolase family protein [Bacillus cereus]|nr:nucleoside triphosphate pyrophosphohydrolase family protein [Bacillus cereus]
MTNTKDLKIGFDWEPKKKEIKEGMLIKYNCLGEILYGVVDKIEDDRIHCYWSNDEGDTTQWCYLNRILDAWDIVVHKPKESKPEKLVPTKPYAQLVAYDYFEDGSRKWGVFTYIEEDTVFAYWGEHCPTRMPLDRIVAVEDIILYDTKEQNLSAAQELSVQQETNNFAHAAVQGIINAHAIKLEEDILREMNKPDQFTFDDFDLSVLRTWKKQDFKDAVSNAALGLTGEAGEVADLIKKAVYHGRGFNDGSLRVRSIGYDYEHGVSPEDVKDELSDVLFYVSAMAQEFGFTLEDVAKHNREKLEKRFPDGFSTEASAQKVDRAPEVKPDGEILIGYCERYKEDTLKYIKVDRAPFNTTYFSTDYYLKKTLKELRDGNRVTIEDKHKGEFKFTKVGNLMRVPFKDLEGSLDSHTCLVKVSYKEVTN